MTKELRSDSYNRVKVHMTNNDKKKFNKKNIQKKNIKKEKNIKNNIKYFNKIP